MSPTFSLSLDPRMVLRVVAPVVIAVVLVGAGADLALTTYPGETTERVLQRLSLATDTSVPTFLAATLLAGCAVLLAASARAEELRGHKAGAWWLLAGVFAVLALDEVAMLHELSGKVLEALVPAVGEWGGLVHYSWVLVGIPAVLLLGVVLGRWFFRLDAKTRGPFALAAILFLSGAIGVEMMNGAIDEAVAGRSRLYALSTAIEEGLEFAGTLAFLHALVARLGRAGTEITIRFRGCEATGAAGRATRRSGPSSPKAANDQPGWRTGS
ncbi:hypothetical protein WJT74_09385 [Sphingomicrobium sp. XHP0239]|uniref:hypothetical protein n=1 Tax=Sphingomicrobium maritimum TaxID=3133972 RepID=UPI0031CCB5D2